MNKHQAQQLIKETFENAFDGDQFAQFIRDFLNGIVDVPFKYRGKYIPDAYKQYIKTLERIGKFSDGKNNIDILVVALKKDTSLERARTMQRNFIAWYLNGSRGGEMKDAALVAYVSPGREDWRFSLVKMDYRFEKTKSGQIKVKEEFTPARRWSFLVGAHEKSHTAQSRLVNILANDEQDPTLEEIEQAFDIETVTKEFFLKYRELFLRTKDALDKVVKKDPKIKADFEKKGVDTVNFAKKLLGQIIFLYFLQKKGWFGVGRDDDWGTGSKQFLRELFKKTHGNYNNFYNDILEPLFYEALRIDRSHDDDYYSRFNCKIPFLNGGLFDPIGNYDWVHTDILLPDSLFSNTRKTKEGDIGDGILDVFDRYNFTVKEDEPLEKEVAIDPELLGKAYEKFNAIRPDNFDGFKKALKSGRRGEENKFNKKFGVYYTPREIVHYMCQQSLINYLDTTINRGKKTSKTGQVIQKNLLGPQNPEQLPITSDSKIISKEDIEKLIHTGEQVSENEARVLRKGKETKTYFHKLPESIRNHAALIDEKLADITVCDPAVGSGAFPVGMMSEIVKVRNVLTTFISNENRTPYEFKRRCIEHSLYGVDIDPGAVEIAKLRLWLSLLVDEEDIKNIKPLPNLDYKVVCGNSLLGIKKDPFNFHLFIELENLKPLFFNETNPSKKQGYKTQIDDLINQITNENKKFDFEIYFSEVFHEKDGFDVVIANPPYQGFRDLDKKFKSSLIKSFVSAQGKFDLYIPFIEQGYKILRENGFFIFICPTGFTKREHGKHIRKFLFSNVCLNELLDFEHSQIFDGATNYTGIFSFRKSSRSKNNLFSFRKGFSEEKLICSQKHLSREKSWIFTDIESKSILDIIYENQPLERIAHISEGVVTGLNALYLKTIKDLKEKNLEKTFFYPTLRGKEIGKYYLSQNSEWLFYPYILNDGKTVPIEEDDLEKQCPHLHSYLKDNLRLINSRKYFVSSSKKWFELWNQRNIMNFMDVKIVTPELAETNRFMLAPPNIYYGDTVCGIRIKDELKNRLDVKYLLSILNSRLIEWFYKKTTVPKAGGFFIYKVMYLKSIPIKVETYSNQKPFVTLVDHILSITKDDDYFRNTTKQKQVKKIEKQIDSLVYKIYGMAKQDIKIVEDEN